MNCKKEVREMGKEQMLKLTDDNFKEEVINSEPVSYTHLTLPTNREV